MATSDEKTIEVKSDNTNIIERDYAGKRENFETALQKHEHDSVITELLNCNGDYSKIKSPLIREENGRKVLQLRFDMNNFSANEIVVKAGKNKITISATHKEETEESSSFRERTQWFTLPDLIKPETVQISLSRDGVLTLIGPLPPSKSAKK